MHIQALGISKCLPDIVKENDQSPSLGQIPFKKKFSKELEAKKLQILEKKNLMQRFLRVTEGDNEQFLLKPKNQSVCVKIDDRG